MDLKPRKRSDAVEYPAFRKFHLNRRTLAAGTALILAGCSKEPEITPAMPGQTRMAQPPANLVDQTGSTSEVTAKSPAGLKTNQQEYISEHNSLKGAKLGGKMVVPKMPQIISDEDTDPEAPMIFPAPPPPSQGLKPATNEVIRLMGEVTAPFPPETE